MPGGLSLLAVLAASARTSPAPDAAGAGILGNPSAILALNQPWQRPLAVVSAFRFQPPGDDVF
jgi:hypothetical protein